MRLIDADKIGLTNFEIIMCDGNYKEALKMLLNKIDNAPTVEQQWIPCNERMPKENNQTGAGQQYSDYVLISIYNTDDDEAFIDWGYTINGSWQSDTTDCLVPPYWEVVAWQPLPEPYKTHKERSIQNGQNIWKRTRLNSCGSDVKGEEDA